MSKDDKTFHHDLGGPVGEPLEVGERINNGDMYCIRCPFTITSAWPECPWLSLGACNDSCPHRQTWL